MKNIKLPFFLAGFIMLLLSTASCKKADHINPATGGTPNTGVHLVKADLVGKWLWTKASDGAYYDDNGVYSGSAYGFAMQFTIHADGSGTAFNHLYSSIGAGTGLEVNISYQGFFESDEEGHLGFFPTSGTYQSSSGENRALRASELWDVKTNKGNSFLYQKVVVTKQGGRSCFQVTASNGVVDTFFRIP